MNSGSNKQNADNNKKKGKNKQRSLLDRIKESKSMDEEAVAIAVANSSRKLKKDAKNISTFDINRRCGRDYMRWAEGKGIYGNSADLSDAKWKITREKGWIPLEDMKNPAVIKKYFS